MLSASALYRGIHASASASSASGIHRRHLSKLLTVGGGDGRRNLVTSTGATLKSSVAAAAAEPTLSHREDWMANLNRDDSTNAALLTVPRPVEWYTGTPPHLTPGVQPDGRLTSLPLLRLDSVTRSATQDYFDNTWTLYELLFASIDGEEYFYRPPNHGLRHPQIFYYGHTACLYVNKLVVAGLLDKGVDRYMENIYEVGVDEMLWDDMHKNDMIWPTVKETHEYRKEVYNVVKELIQTHPGIGKDESSSTKVTWDDPLWALFMGFEHERIHFETSSVLFREAPLHLVKTPHEEAWAPVHPSASTRNGSPNGRTRTIEPMSGVDYPSDNPMLFPVEQTTVVRLGKPRGFPSYGWDNEYGTRTVSVPPFAASKYMITNGEFFEFVKDGGYRQSRHWSEDGWGWRSFRNAKWPSFWEQDGPAGSNRFRLRTLFDVVDMPWDWPVEVNHHEAKAYCSWRSEKDGGSTTYRLPTEAEWNLLKDPSMSLDACRKDVLADPVMSRSGADFVRDSDGDDPTHANLNWAYSSASPVGSIGAPSASGHCDVVGNVWEHVEDNFNPLEGGLVTYAGGKHMCNYEIHPTYDDFSTPCYDGRHDMIMGGSFASTGDEASAFARFHFRPHFLQHSGFRVVTSNFEPPVTLLNDENKVVIGGSALAKEAVTANPSIGSTNQVYDNDCSPTPTTQENVYESKELLDQYLGFHFCVCEGRNESERNEVGAAVAMLNEVEEALPDGASKFPQRVAKLLFELDTKHNRSLKEPQRRDKQLGTSRVLDLGCSVGGTAFTLATKYDEVVGIDFSQAFVDAANSMKANEDVHFDVPLEGDLSVRVRACHGDDVDDTARSRTVFRQGDACTLNVDELGKFDSVVASNLICRLPRPRDCLEGLSHLVNPGGLVLMTTPFTWLEEFTPREHWLGGRFDEGTGEYVRSDKALLEAMEEFGFERVYKKPMPLFIREHRRKYQLIVADATGWRRL